MCVVNHDQDMIAGDATTNEELLGDVLQLLHRAGNFRKSNLRQKSAVELLLAMASFIDDHTADAIANAGNETVQQRGFPRPVSTAYDDKGIAIRRRIGQMLRQERILLTWK